MTGELTIPDLTTDARAGRLLELDGLRGLAALAVVLYHFNGELAVQIAKHWPTWVSDCLKWGYLGVAVFFTLSGYAIASSLREYQLSPKFCAKYAARRAVRLDPPYWTSLALALSLSFAKALLFPSEFRGFPTASCVVAHLAYLQGILGCEHIVPIYWTLCFEVQFYLFLLIIIAACQWLVRKRSQAREKVTTNLAYASAFTMSISIAIRYHLVALSADGLALDAWCMFCLGCLSYWSTTHRVAMRTLMLATFVAACIWIIYGKGDMNLPVAMCVALALANFSRIPTMGLPLRIDILQWLGAKSYSLYLFHGIVGWAVVSILVRATPDALVGPVTLSLIFSAGVVSSLIFATVSYWLVEAPTVRLSRKIRLF